MTIRELEEAHGKLAKQLQEHAVAIEENKASMADVLEKLNVLLKRTEGTPAEPTPRTSFPPPPEPKTVVHGRSSRLDFPRFEGVEPEAWIFQADQFFTFHPLSDWEKVNMASIHLRGDSIAWFRWLHKSLGTITWAEFCIKLCKRFGSRKNLDPLCALSKLTQTGTVSAYITQFEVLLNLVPDLLDPHQVSLFLAGLRPDIQAGVRLMAPLDLSHAFDLALCQEDAITATRSFRTSSVPSRFAPRQQHLSSLPKPADTTPAVAANTRKFSWEEQRARRAKGLCFYCDDLYKPGHRCVSPQLLLMEGDDDIEAEEPVHFEEEETEPPDAIQVSLHALSGYSGSSTMRILAKIKNVPISILVDSGSTHNFVHPSVARRCGLHIETSY